MGLNNSEAGRLVGVSHTAIAKAKDRHRLPTLADGTVDREALLKWAGERRTPRGGAPNKVAAQSETVSPSAPEVAAVPAAVRAALKMPASNDGRAAANAEAALALLTAEGVFADRADAERYRDSYVARLRQIEYEEKSGKLLPADDVTRAISGACAMVKTRMLAVPAEQAPALHRLKTVVELRDALTKAITDALDQLVAQLRKRPD